jgi:hypothetical protein
MDVDLSTNGIGHTGTVAIEHAMKEWNAKTPSTPLFVNLEGNLVFPEVRTILGIRRPMNLIFVLTL